VWLAHLTVGLTGAVLMRSRSTDSGDAVAPASRSPRAEIA